MAIDDTPAVQRHLHWDFLAHDGEEHQVGDIHWAVAVAVIGYETESDARIAAQAIVQRKSFILRKVWECPSCGYQSAMAESMRGMVAKI